MQKQIALRSILAREDMLPGDYLSHDFYGSALLQLVATGMKLKHLQDFLNDTLLEFGGENLADDPLGIMAWLVHCFQSCSPDPVAQSQHGDNANCCGPTMFLQQVGITTDVPPYSSAAPLRFPTDKLYYMARDPSICLRKLHAAFEHGYPCEVRTGQDYVEGQMRCSRILVDCMLGVNMNYTAPQLTKKLFRHWAVTSGMSFQEVPIGDLRKAVADQKGGLDHFLPDMPSSMLTELFGVFPLDWAVWYCLVEKVVETPDHPSFGVEVGNYLAWEAVGVSFLAQ